MEMDGATWLLVIFFVYLWAPIKHPCDYGSFEAWRDDWRNWLKR